MKNYNFIMRFYGQTEDKVKECCERIKGAHKDILGYEIVGKVDYTRNIIAPAECIQANLFLESEQKARKLLENEDVKRIYEEYANNTKIPSRTYAVEPGDNAYNTLIQK